MAPCQFASGTLRGHPQFNHHQPSIPSRPPSEVLPHATPSSILEQIEEVPASSMRQLSQIVAATREASSAHWASRAERYRPRVRLFETFGASNPFLTRHQRRHFVTLSMNPDAASTPSIKSNKTGEGKKDSVHLVSTSPKYCITQCPDCKDEGKIWIRPGIKHAEAVLPTLLSCKTRTFNTCLICN